MPNTPFDLEPRENLLSYEELFQFLKIAIDLGIKKVRITGGEPLLRRDLDRFIGMLRDYNSQLEIALTTNGYYLAKQAEKLKKAGLDRVNISLDSLQPKVAAQIAQREMLENVLKGIDRAIEVGLGVKLNSVIMAGINDREIVELLEFGRQKGVIVRFIEFMENQRAYPGLKGVPAKEILAQIGNRYRFVEEEWNNSASRYFRLEDGYRFGIIEPHNPEFCKRCNRIRLTAEGFLIPCLYFEDAREIKDSIRNGRLEEAEKILKEVVWNKPEKNLWNEGEGSSREFYITGG